jgi:hypothetical protein
MKGATMTGSREFRFRPAGFPGVYAENQARMSIFTAARQTSPPGSSTAQKNHHGEPRQDAQIFAHSACQG